MKKDVLNGAILIVAMLITTLMIFVLAPKESPEEPELREYELEMPTEEEIQLYKEFYQDKPSKFNDL
ncbi:hypothetical protein [Oceanobacillus kimchii]|uniref:hypothetical protein n=1 Tax=Oceanobacillus kimchii TaxID=746691 RepID=UPI003C77D1AA